MASPIKRSIKRGVKRAAGVVGPWLAPLSGSRILTYHSVGHRKHEMNVRPEAFAAQMQWLADHATVIPLREAARGGEGVAITFDDGYVDNLTNAAPILQRHHFPATVFMVAGRAGGMLDHDTDETTSRLMNWDEVRALQDAGVEIGGHTMTHARLSRLDTQGQAHEIGECARVLTRELGKAPEAFAYPYGSAADYNAISQTTARASGYAYAVSNRYGTNPAPVDQWALRRIWIDETDTLAIFAAKVTGRLDLLTALESPLGLWLRRALNRSVR